MAKWAKRLHDKKRAAKQGKSNEQPKHKIENGNPGPSEKKPKPLKKKK